MRQRDDERLSTADVAANGPGARSGRDESRSPLDEPVPRDAGGPERIRTIESADERREGRFSGHAPLFDGTEASDLRARWEEIQSSFVDAPRRSVESADELVAEVMQRLAQVFANERGELETQWAEGDDVSTEDLRVALQKYRSFFDRLLSV